MLIIFFLPEKVTDKTVRSFLKLRRLFIRCRDFGWHENYFIARKTRRGPAASFLFRAGDILNAGSDSFSAARWRRPMRALFRKEFQLHSIALIGGGILLGMHIVVFLLRAFYANAHRNSTMAVISDFFWVLWLVMPMIIGCMAVAEERKLGVADEQFCLPVSRRLQFLIKFLPTMFFGILFGGIMPLLLEGIAVHLGNW